MPIIVEILKKYKGVLMYIIFGVLTTLVNIVSYHVFFNLLGIKNVPSTCVAWLIAVSFAFITNKLLVFDSKSLERSVVLKELKAFFICRILTGILDVGIMYVAVDILSWNAVVWKTLSNGMVIVLNYIASKLVIFKK